MIDCWEDEVCWMVEVGPWGFWGVVPEFCIVVPELPEFIVVPEPCPVTILWVDVDPAKLVVAPECLEKLRIDNSAIKPSVVGANVGAGAWVVNMVLLGEGQVWSSLIDKSMMSNNSSVVETSF